MTGTQRVVLLTGDEVQHRFVARALAEGPGLAAIVVNVGVRRSRMARVKRAATRFGVRRLAARVALRWLLVVTGERRRRNRALLTVLGDPPFPEPVPRFTVAGVNTSEAQSILEELQPDVLCVYGTSLVSDKTLSIARHLALNLHTGISPRYRGADCSFWPLHRQEPEWLGATVHECTAKVDGGAIYAVARPHLAANDGVGEVFARCVAEGARLYAKVVGDVMAGTAVGNAQDLSAGTEYRAAMHDWRAELTVRSALRGGLIRDYVAAGQPEARDARMPT